MVFVTKSRAIRHVCLFLKPLADKHSQTVAYSSVLTDITNTLLGQAVQGNAPYTQSSIQATLKALTSGQDICKSV